MDREAKLMEVISNQNKLIDRLARYYFEQTGEAPEGLYLLDPAKVKFAGTECLLDEESFGGAEAGPMSDYLSGTRASPSE